MQKKTHFNGFSKNRLNWVVNYYTSISKKTDTKFRAYESYLPNYFHL